jgi:hypothetical protein
LEPGVTAIDSDLKEQAGAPATRDYFAEMYVAGLLADAGWDIYFPRRDKGFDMIVTRPTSGGTIVRPVQVKGKYATDDKSNKTVYGYVGKLTALHNDMVLVVPFFTSTDAHSPRLVAWAPRSAIREVSRGYAFEPATFVSGSPEMRRDFRKFFGEDGLQALASAGQ